MANAKEYAYYQKGNKLAIVEKDTAFNNDPNSTDYGPGSNRAQFKSPLSSVTDGLEIEYTYAPDYVIETTAHVDTTNINALTNSSGFLVLYDATSSYTNFANPPYSLSANDYIVLRNAGEFNGLHRITQLQSVSGTNERIITDTPYNGTAVTSGFAPSLYYSVSALREESDVIPLTAYQVQALECYVRAKVAMDTGNIDLKEYYMKEFRKKLEKHETSKVWGARMVAPGPHSIR